MSRVVINVADQRDYDYVKWQKRLAESLDRFNVPHLMWGNHLPPDCPEHEKSPYAFKLVAFHAAMKIGYTSIIWMDAGLHIAKPLDPIFEILESDGMYLVKDRTTLSRFCSDETFEYFNTTREREERDGTTLASGSLIGLTLSGAGDLWHLWYDAYAKGLYSGTVSKHSGQEDHRGDETILSLIAKREGFILHPLDRSIIGSGYHED